jgi:uncharacterized membrane protein YfcA
LARNVLGGLLGAHLAVGLPNAVLSKIFGVALLALGVHMIFRR